MGRWLVSGSLFWPASQSEKTLSAAATVGSSLLAGVPVFDRDRRVDFPNEPVSGTAFLGRPNEPSWLFVGQTCQHKQIMHIWIRRLVGIH